MGLFSRKQKVRLGEFCTDFYDKNILNAVVGDVDANAVYADLIKRTVAEVDGRFAVDDSARFTSELKLIRFEVFGLAWLHQLGDNYTAALSEFTKNYLKDRGQGDAWNAMQPYNQAIVRSCTAGHSFETLVGRTHLTVINRMRADSADAWLKQGFEADESVGRAVNRLGATVAWGRSLTPGFLMLALCKRLGCEVNEPAQGRLIAVIRGFYDGARQSLKGVKVEN